MHTDSVQTVTVDRSRMVGRIRIISNTGSSPARPLDLSLSSNTSEVSAIKSPRIDNGSCRNAIAATSCLSPRLSRAQDDPPSEPPSPVISLPSFLSSSGSEYFADRKPSAPYPIRLRTHAPPQPTTGRPDLSPLLWLGGYFTLNLILTLQNKFILADFPFPYFVTSIHTLFTSFGVRFLRSRGAYVPAALGSRENAVLLAFSILYTVNIAVSNVSLHLVSVPFHQVVRGMTPLFTIALSASLLGTKCSSAKWLSLVPVILGVAFATYGDYSFTTYGLFLSVLGAILAACKTVLTSMLQSPRLPSRRHESTTSRTSRTSRTSGLLSTIRSTRLALHPLDLLERLSTLASAQCLLFAICGGEFPGARAAVRSQPPTKLLGVLANGGLALALNIASFYAARRTSPVAMSVAGNVKQVLTIVLAVALFNLRLTPINILGIACSLIGGAWYARVEYTEKNSGKNGKT